MSGSLRVVLVSVVSVVVVLSASVSSQPAPDPPAWSVLIVLKGNPRPYGDRGVTRNALLLTRELKDGGADVRLFLMGASADLATTRTWETISRETAMDKKPLVKIMKELVAKGVPIKACGVPNVQISGPAIKEGPYYAGPKKATIGDLSVWIGLCDRILVF